MICQYRDIQLTIKRKVKMQNWPFNFHIFLFQFSNFQFCQFSSLIFNFCQFKAPLQICYCCRYTHQNDAVLHVVFLKKKKKHLTESTRLFLNQNKTKGFQSLTLRERERERERETEVAAPARHVNHFAALPWLNQWWVCSALPYRSFSSPVLRSARGAWRVQEECHVGRIVHEFLNRLGVGIDGNRVSDTDTRHAVWERGGHLREFQLGSGGLSRLKSFFRCNQKLWLGVGKVKLKLLRCVSLVQRRRYGSTSNHCQKHHHKLHKTKNKKVKILIFVYFSEKMKENKKERKLSVYLDSVGKRESDNIAGMDSEGE